MEFGLPVAKFFPAGQMGGVKTIKAIAAAFPNMLFMPTGCVNAANIKEYLAYVDELTLDKDAVIYNEDGSVKLDFTNS